MTTTSSEPKRTQPNLTTIRSLANEILVSIASYLPAKDLCALALVSKQFTPIGQECLYRSPYIPASGAPQQPNDHPLATFLRTLIKNPALAKLIRHLRLEPQPRSETFDYATVLPIQAAKALNVPRPTRPKLSQYAIISMILERTENLQVLDLEMVAREQSSLSKYHRDRYAHRTMALEALFRWNGMSKLEKDLAAIIARIGGLQSITALKFDGAFFEHRWCLMPSLTALHFGRHCCLAPRHNIEDLTTNIHTISVEISARDFRAQIESVHQFNRVSPGFLGQFPQLKHLILRICNTVVGHRTRPPYAEYTTNAIRRVADPDFDTFVQSRLAGVAATLEHLDIIYHDDVCENSAIKPQLKWRIRPASFTSFVKLRSLEVPHVLLLGELDDGISRLPRQLEHLWVTQIDQGAGNIWYLLEAVAVGHESFADLAKVQLSALAGKWLTGNRYAEVRTMLQDKEIEVKESFVVKSD